MIVISELGKSIELIHSWDDMYSRPGFRKRVDPALIKVKEIIGKYRLPPEKRPCGLSSCREPHFKGYLVSLENGEETNIGGHCGRKIFGVVFEEHEKSFQRHYNAQRSREVIQAAQHRVQSVRGTVQELRQGEWGADEAYRRMHRQITQLFDGGTKLKLTNRARQMNTTVFRSTRRTEEDMEEARIMGDRNEFTEEFVFQIAGVAAPLEYPKLRNIMNVQLGSELDAFEQLQADSLGFKELRQGSNWANRIDQRLRKARSILEDCHRLLQPDNLARIRNHRRLL